jgi:hypothetical protein
MAVGYNPRIVTNGLVLYLDAGNTRSYPGSGTTWTDLSGNGNNGTLSAMDGTNFSSTNGGKFSFDGINERVGCGNASSLQITVGTISAWFKAANPNGGYNGIITKQSAWGLFVTNNILIAYDWGGGGNRSTGITVGDNTWHNATMTFTETIGTPSNNAIIYLDGRPVLTTTVKHSNQNVEVQIGDGNATQFYTGDIAQASIYNRVLSAAEIRQNFNALRGRYGI